MKVLLVGAGVVGTVFGAHLAADGHAVSVLAHGRRTHNIAASGLAARDVQSGVLVESPVVVVESASAIEYDVVLAAVRSDQLAAAAAGITDVAGKPRVLFLGNNPAGRAALPDELGGDVSLGFPGIGGTMADGIAQYIRIRQQPTAIAAGSDPCLAEIEATLRRRGFPVQRVEDMDGWLGYHTVFIGCVAEALYRCGTDAARLADDRRTLLLMYRAITAGFAALHAAGLGGRPRGLAVLHSPALRPIAERYWARTMRSPMGELCFAAHCRHAEPEMRELGTAALHLAGDSRQTAALTSFLRL